MVVLACVGLPEVVVLVVERVLVVGLATGSEMRAKLGLQTHWKVGFKPIAGFRRLNVVCVLLLVLLGLETTDNARVLSANTVLLLAAAAALVGLTTLPRVVSDALLFVFAAVKSWLPLAWPALFCAVLVAFPPVFVPVPVALPPVASWVGAFV